VGQWEPLYTSILGSVKYSPKKIVMGQSKLLLAKGNKNKIKLVHSFPLPTNTTHNNNMYQYVQGMAIELHLLKASPPSHIKDPFLLNLAA